VSLTEALPSDWYVEPAYLDGELARVFDRSWQYAGPAELVAEPGTFLTTRAGRVPIVVTRDTDGELNAFVNVCRHRGAEVARERNGSRKSLQCHYHAWTYGLDGRLRAAPRAEPGFADDGPGLVPMAVGTWGPFVFVNPDAGAPPLAEALGDLPELVRAHGLDVDALRFHHRAEYEIRANWKIALENYLECYHCRLNHPGLVAVIDDRRLSMDASGLRASQFNPAHPDFDVAGGLPSGQFHLLFPSLKVNVEPGPLNLSIGPVWPVAPDRCRGYLDYFFAPDASAQWIAEFLAFDDQVGAEDTALVEAAQAGAGSGLVADGYLLPHDEQLIAHFQEYVRANLNGA
jgi:phenylpropionate dioxygenase-like ring-hydroxylating dioxygenase large terminal subunit